MGCVSSSNEKKDDAPKSPAKLEPVTYKIVIIGESGVGKTSLLMKFLDSNFDVDSSKDINLDEPQTKVLKLGGQDVTLQITDTAGQERYRQVTSSFFRGVNGVFIVYDVSQKDTFDTLKKWLDETRRYASVNANIFVVGNKTDLNDKISVTTEEAKMFASTNQVGFLETSAKSGANVQQAFEELAKAIQAQEQT